MRTHQNRRARQSVQLQLPFSWAPTRANEPKRHEANCGGYRNRPANDDDPFTQARGFIPPVGAFGVDGRQARHNAKRVE
ncbi:hypothetical protein GCM10010836_05370 [Aminobacter aminovorans]